MHHTSGGLLGDDGASDERNRLDSAGDVANAVDEPVGWDQIGRLADDEAADLVQQLVHGLVGLNDRVARNGLQLVKCTTSVTYKMRKMLLLQRKTAAV